MDGMPPGVPALPPPDSTMLPEQRLAYAREKIDAAEAMAGMLADSHSQGAKAAIDGAMQPFGELLAAQTNTAQDNLNAAEKKLAKAVKPDIEAVGNIIQGAYDYVRSVGHTPVVDLPTIYRLNGENYPYPETVSAYTSSPASEIHDTVAGTQPAADASGPTEDAAYIEAVCRIFGEPGTVEYELCRHSRLAPSIPYDVWRPDTGIVTAPAEGVQQTPRGYLYAPTIDAFVPISAVPGGQKVSAALQQTQQTAISGAISGADPPTHYPFQTCDGDPPVCDPPSYPWCDGTTGQWTCKTLILPPPPPPPPPPPGPPVVCPPGYYYDIGSGTCILNPDYQPPRTPFTPPSPPLPPRVPPSPPVPPVSQSCDWNADSDLDDNGCRYLFCAFAYTSNSGDVLGGISNCRTTGHKEKVECWIRYVYDPPGLPQADRDSFAAWMAGDKSEDWQSSQTMPPNPSTGAPGPPMVTVQYTCLPVGPPPPPPPPPPPGPPTSCPPLNYPCVMLVPCPPPGKGPPPPPPPPPPPSPPTTPPTPSQEPSKIGSTDVCTKIPTWINDLDGSPLIVGHWGVAKLNENIDVTKYPILGTLLAIGMDMVGASGSLSLPWFDMLGWDHPAAMSNISGVSSVLGWTERLTGADLAYLKTPVEQAFRYDNPLDTPDQSAVDELYLRDLVTDTIWECLTKILGNRPELARQVRDGKQERLNLADCLRMYLRQYWDENTLKTELRKRGVIDDSNIDNWKKLLVEIPGWADLAHMLLRDTADPTYDWTSSDESLTKKWLPPLSTWAQQQGIPYEMAQHLWRAHWIIPSVSFLYDAVARLRPDRAMQVAENMQAAGLMPPDTNIESFAASLMVDYDTARRTMIHNDVEPRWVDRQLALGNVPINATDVKVGHKNGVITKDESYEMLRDLRYNDKDARLLTDFLVADANRQRANESNLWSRANIVKEYMGGGLDRGKAFTLLRRFVFTDELANQALDDADDKARVTTVNVCKEAIRKRVLRGQLTELEATYALSDLGISDDYATLLAKQYSCYRDSREREPSIALIKRWLKQGVISAEDAYMRLLNLRYLPDDARRILAVSESELSQASAKEAERLVRQRQADARTARSTWRAEVGFHQKQVDRKRTLAKKGLPDDTVESDGTYIPPPPPPPATPPPPPA